MKTDDRRPFPIHVGRLTSQVGRLEGLVNQMAALLPIADKLLPLLTASGTDVDAVCPGDLISVKEAAQMLSLRPASIDKLISSGRLRSWRLPSRQRRVSRAEVLSIPEPEQELSGQPRVTGHQRRKTQRFTRATLARYGIELGEEAGHDA